MADWSFIDHVTDALDRPRPGDSKHPTLWPSEATAVVTTKSGTQVLGKCRRARFFRFMLECYKFYPKYSHWKPIADVLVSERLPTDRYLLWIWRQGELYEDFLVEQAKVSGVYSCGQVPIYIKQFNVSGKEDIEILNPYTRKFSIIEAKSVYGFGGNIVLGSPSDRRNNQLGKPKDSNLMQIGLYHWWKASMDDAYEESRLVYGSRDTGRYAEYLVKTVAEEEDGETRHYIWYKGNAPVSTAWTKSPFCIENILFNYQETQKAVDGGYIPSRDFKLVYDEDDLAKASAAGDLNKTEQTQYDKVIARREENLERIAEGKKPKQELKQIVKGDWQCKYCDFQRVCWNQDGTPREL